jgi:small subunit ribosomal protein S8
MTMTDPVADYLTRVRNAIGARRKSVDIPASNLKRELTKVLLAAKLIEGFSEMKDTPQGTIRVHLKYTDGAPVISGLKRISTPGLRRYVDAGRIPRVMGGLGVAVLSTSSGLMTDKQARVANVGGEVLCEIW